MQLSLNNIGIIREAHINLTGLTVIAGENDTGKSTIGKTLFSLIKAFSGKSVLTEQKKIAFLESLEIFYTHVSKLIDLNEAHVQEIKKILYPPELLEELLFEMEAKSSLQLKTVKINGIFNYIRELLSELVLADENMQSLNDKLDTIERNFINHLQQDENGIKASLKNELVHQFANKIKNIEHSEEPIIGLSDEEQTVLINITSSANLEISSGLDYMNHDFKYVDATLIETPLIINLLSLIDYFSTISSISSSANPQFELSKQTIDLISKIKFSQYATQTVYAVNPLLELIDEITGLINGDFEFKGFGKGCLFTKNMANKKLECDLVNVASGIKALGIIQLLIKSGAIDRDTLLILDEPETHLHPDWQVKFAELIVKLAEKGIPVVLSSHSAYFIQAIRFYSEKADIADLTSYHLAELESGTNSSVINDVTQDLNQIFIKLATPLHRLL